MTTFDKIASIISEQRSIDKNSITLDSTLDSLGADSIDRVEIIIKIEEEFGIEINDEDSEKISTVGQAVDYVDNLLAKK